jgi:hypothetical protein
LAIRFLVVLVFHDGGNNNGQKQSTLTIYSTKVVRNRFQMLVLVNAYRHS